MNKSKKTVEELEAELEAARAGSGSAPEAPEPTEITVESVEEQLVALKAEREEINEEFDTYVRGVQAKLNEKKEQMSKKASKLDTRITELTGVLKYLKGEL